MGGYTALMRYLDKPDAIYPRDSFIDVNKSHLELFKSKQQSWVSIVGDADSGLVTNTVLATPTPAPTGIVRPESSSTAASANATTIDDTSSAPHPPVTAPTTQLFSSIGMCAVMVICMYMYTYILQQGKD